MSDAPAVEILNVPQLNTDGSAVGEAPIEAAPVETPVEAAPAPNEQDAAFAKKFAALSRKEKAIRQQQDEIAQLKADLETQKSSVSNEYDPLKKSYDSIKENPLQALQDQFGLSFEDLTEMALNNNNPTAEMQIKKLRDEMENKMNSQVDDKLKALEEKLQSYESKEQDKVEAEAKQNYLNHITEFINENEGYDTVKAWDAIPQVYSIVEKHFQETGEIMEVADAAKEVEGTLWEQAQKLTSSKKFQSNFTSALAQNSETEKPRQESVTLSNANASMAPTGNKKLNREESLAEVAKLLKWDA